MQTDFIVFQFLNSEFVLQFEFRIRRFAKTISQILHITYNRKMADCEFGNAPPSPQNDATSYGDGDRFVSPFF